MSGDVLGIVPAAGKATRFSGAPKEMLPVGDQTLIRRAMSKMRDAGVSRFLVITNWIKDSMHEEHLKQWRASYVIQKKAGIWGAVQESFLYAAENNLFVMPDTYFEGLRLVDADLAFGCFVTFQPERFGVLMNGSVVDKQQLPVKPYPYIAWGTIQWSREVMEFWAQGKFEGFPEALSAAMQVFEYRSFMLDTYHDMASFEDYRSLLCG